ncbi:MAG: CoA-transferase [Eubacteriales bacterium]|nr:CoA-transferase [Eubacteriales bacterium]
MNWTAKQMMAIGLARMVENGKSYIVGTGLPLVSATLAKNTYAPECKLIVETGIFEGAPVEVPSGVADMRNTLGASVLWPQYRYFGFQSVYGRRGDIACGFLGGAQIDPYGNLNSTCIGDYYHPQTRFTGSGGANGIATYLNTFIIMKHQKRRFTEHVDYVTSPGWIDGPDGRKKAGLLPDRGPLAVVTELGIMKFDEKTKRLYLAEYFPGVTAEQVRDNTGFEIDISRATESAPPEPEVLYILLNKVDPYHMMV